MVENLKRWQTLQIECMKRDDKWGKTKNDEKLRMEKAAGEKNGKRIKIF